MFSVITDGPAGCVPPSARAHHLFLVAEKGWPDDMMFPSFSPPPSTPLFLVLLRLVLLSLSSSSSSSSSFSSHAPLSWTSPHDPCYHQDGRPRHCLPEFINAAYGLPVNASPWPRGPEPGGGVATLTDLHNPHNLTCWSEGPGAGAGDRVLTLPLGRRFEITYISLQFCGRGEPPEPLAVSILKSMDHGRTWRPMQHYAHDCAGVFRLPAQTAARTRHQETEPLCSDPRPLQRQRGGAVLAFSALDGRPSAPDFDYSPTLQDWVTATDIRVVFHGASRRGEGGEKEAAEDGTAWRDVLKWRPDDKADRPSADNTLAFFDGGAKRSATRGGSKEKGGKGHGKGSGRDEDGHNATSKESEDRFGADSLVLPKRAAKGRGHGRHRPCPGGGCNWTVEGRGRSGGKGRELRKRRNHNPNPNARQGPGSPGPAPSGLAAPARTPLAISDLQVGGRCKCNGHASRCRRDEAGRAVCVCEHHTAGPDCDVCEDFYLDRPWHRATPTQPNPCVACECNGHSDKCRFSMEVFQQSGRRSGGVCQKCRHHTAGRHCQYCQSGYTRDHSKPLHHRKACQPCQCHPLGAVGRWCNQTSGQCLCREGVTGPRCNRCAPGYKQGKSPLRPCIKIQEVAPTPVYQPQYSIVLKVQVRGMERSGPWWQFSIAVQTVFRSGSGSRVRRGSQALWVPDRDLGCGCPALQVGRTFLLIGAEEGERGWGPGESRLVADRSTLALQWREHWSPKLRGFRGQDRRGRCPPKPPVGHRRRGEQARAQAGYVPPHLLTQKRSEPRLTTPGATETPQSASSSSALGLVCSTPNPD
ncbi:unnamed protein product [Menidia menidia]|uniref:(Atlantic silverside) hypothetical protein n=1 Tax=Menidia menidia TaxID=238744 RepID=A0A8S4B4R3_9TELE|nr:unnamed protein product [Menidia menidia]